MKTISILITIMMILAGITASANAFAHSKKCRVIWEGDRPVFCDEQMRRKQKPKYPRYRKAKQKKGQCYSMRGSQRVCFENGKARWFFNGVSTD